MRKPINISGQKFGRLTAIKWLGYKQTGANKKSLWLASCDCGNTKEILYQSLIQGRSCGCLMKETSSMTCIKRNTSHGLSLHYKEEYQTWKRIKQRCHNKNNPKYPDYGDRGIKVCERWLNSFEYFLEDMGKRPSFHSIDRINNDGDYEPSNCRWATQITQANNRRYRRYGKRPNKESIRVA